jgi:hypothetical protein
VVQDWVTDVVWNAISPLVCPRREGIPPPKAMMTPANTKTKIGMRKGGIADVRFFFPFMNVTLLSI